MIKSVFVWVLCFGIGFAFGAAVMAKKTMPPIDPEPEQCLSVCVDYFERMGC